ncbi:LIM domain only protein 7-like [Watersipora subatra]|uniref:LIM domain only protein 7-like n=1 Tax=Watersipora subatra TaxID=2589382 RepID=UPI00355BB160
MDYQEEDEGKTDYLVALEQKEREELEFYTDLAVQEMQRWIECVTRKKFKYPDDPKRSLSDGVLLCELLNGIKPGTIKRINRLPTAMAGMDNLNVFIEASKKHFGLKEAQLFAPTDLQDFAERHRENEPTATELKETEDRKIRNVAIAVFWLARQVQGFYTGPELDFTNFTALVNAKSLGVSFNSPVFHQHQHSSSSDWTEPESLHYRHSVTSSRDSTDEMNRRSVMDRREGRYSSSDSLDDYERASSQSCLIGLRRTSSTQPAIDPLQFVASKPAINLALTAEKQLELVRDTKLRRGSETKDEVEWQVDLSSWKQRRKSSRKSGVILPEREANELQTDNYMQFEKAHTDSSEKKETRDSHGYSLSQSSQSYDDDEAFYSPSAHQKSSSDMSSPRDETPESTREFKPYPSDSSPVVEVIERATIKPVESTSTALMGKGKHRLTLVTNPGSDDGFGFTIKGGKDKCQPIVVESISNDSVADKIGLLEGDEVLEINDEVVTDRNRGYCMLLINGSLQGNGKLELYIKRDNNKGWMEKRLPTAARERKQTSVTAPKNILDIYASMEPEKEHKITQEEHTGSKGLDKLDDEFTRREMEREYRQILDGGYDSAVSTLRSEVALDDRQPYLDTQQEKTTVSPYMDPPTEFVSHQDYEEGESASDVSDRNVAQSDKKALDLTPDSDEQGMETFEQIHDKVTKDFEQVAPSLVKDDTRSDRKGKKSDDDRKRMEEWQRQQEIRRQETFQEEQFKKEQEKMQRDVEKARQEAEEYDRKRQAMNDPATEKVEENSSTLSSLRLGIASTKEKETRDKAVQRLLEIKARYSQSTQNESAAPSEEVKSPTADSSESEDSDDDMAKYRIKSKPKKKDSANEMRDSYTAHYYNYKPEEVNATPKETPYLTDVYKYYEEDIPTNLGERDPTPPPMTRKEVINMNKKSTAWREPKELSLEGERQWEKKALEGERQWEKTAEEDKGWARKEVIAPVDESVPAPWKRPEAPTYHQDNRRKSAPIWNRREDGDGSQSSMSSQRSEKISDVDPSLPSTLRKEDVLKMTREKARFAAQPRRASEYAPASQPINHKTMNAVPLPVRKSNSDWITFQSEDDVKQTEDEENAGQRKSKGFFSNRAMFEQQSREADRYWADQSKETKKQQVKGRAPPARKAFSTVEHPKLNKDFRSKSVDVRTLQDRGDIVRSVAASDAANERRRELAQMALLREAEAEKAEEDERERASRERKARDERQRELAEIRKLNQQYEAENWESSQAQTQNKKESGNRSEELERARKRMAREAEELKRVQTIHDREVKDIHGVDLEERRQQMHNSEPVDERKRFSRDLDGEEAREAAARRRHQELVEQSQRDQQRREEARRVEQVRRQQPPQPLHHSQQSYQQEWRPNQPESSYPGDEERYRLPTPPDDRLNYSNRKEQSGIGNDPRRRAPDARGSWDERRNVYGAPQERRNDYGAPQEVKSDIIRQTQSTQNTPPIRYQPQGYEDRPSTRQPPMGRITNLPYQDSYDRDIPGSASPHRPNSSYDRSNIDATYPSSNGMYNEQHGLSRDYRPPSHTQHSKEPAYAHNQKNGNTHVPHGSDDKYNRATYVRGNNGNPAPSKPPRSTKEAQDELMTVSAKYSCAYCSNKLGKGAAMVIESLGLYYHVDCFRCCVCHSLLSNGQMGADVRVRVNRLHCKNCYSNDDAGIKYSAV